MIDLDLLFNYFERLFPDPKTELKYSNAFELLVATILSAQCTDERVNRVTETLFKKYRSPQDYVAVPVEELEQDIKPTGFYKNKAKSLKKCCEQLIQKFGGEIPRSLEEFTKLPGVGRKTANLVLGNAYGVPGIIADTHVIRVSNRLGLSRGKKADDVEKDLMRIVPRDRWTRFSNQMVLFGRYICKARNPQCDRCELKSSCLYYKSLTNGQ